MSNNNCHSKNLLVRDGTSQKERALSSPDPSSVKIDDRSKQDLLKFAASYGKLLQYYSSDNRKNGNWKEFFASDAATLLGSVIDENSQSLQLSVEILDQKISTSNNTNELTQLLKSYFDLLTTLVSNFNLWFQKTPDNLKLKAELQRLISSGLNEQLYLLISLYKEAGKNPKLFDAGHIDTDILYPLRPVANNLSGYDKIWMAGPNALTFENWDDYFESIPPAVNGFGPERTNRSKSIKFGAKTLMQVYRKFLSALLQLEAKMPAMLNQVFTSYASHEPHLALFITFMQLFGYAQDQLNTITGRHLDFYYKDVLKMQKSPALPDKTHLVLEPAKQVKQHLVPKNTLFKAGKDDEGNELLYSTENDLVINKAEVTDLKALHIDKSDNFRMYAAPIANSADGQGATFEGDDKSFKPFGISQKDVLLSKQTMVDAELGFAVSVPELWMSGGERHITLKITTSGSFTNTDNTKLKDSFVAILTDEEGWGKHKLNFSTTVPSATVKNNILHFSGNTIFVKVFLDETQSAIVPFNAEIHEGNFKTNFPVLKVVAIPDKIYPYKLLKNIDVKQVEVIVKASGVKDLVLQNDNGPLDLQKPVALFGPQPVAGSSFYIGSREIFSKKLSSISLNGNFIEKPTNLKNHYSKYSGDIEENTFKLSAEVLVNGSFQNLTSAKHDMFAVNKNEFKVEVAPGNKYRDVFIPLEQTMYRSGVKWGFARFKLDGPEIGFGHKVFPRLYSDTILHQIKGDGTDPGTIDPETLPNPPYTPLVADFSVDYDAKRVLDLVHSGSFAESGGEFYHIQPFGHKTLHPDLGDVKVHLMPQFSHRKKGNTLYHEGELFIGIEYLNLPEVLSLLIEVKEGSENPDLPKQEVKWFYLSNNNWIAFNNQQLIADSTNGLLKTGIIRFSIPRECDSGNTLMPPEKHWVKAAVDANSGAIPHITNVFAQAVTVVNNGSKPQLLESETISKLYLNDASVKSILQPSATFGGRHIESDNDFYRNVSERLRHKDRAISIWDYERMVLEKFPGIYKVKCINHSAYGFYDKLEKSLNSEFAPGFVSVVLVPDLKNRNVPNPYEPKVTVALREEVKEYLSGKVSAWAAHSIQVLNPLYELVQVELEVEFNSEDRGYYESRLQADIKTFLAPWSYNSQSEINFGGSLHSSVIVEFVENLPYVDFLSNFKMHHWVEGTEHKHNAEAIVPTSARSVITTVSKDAHSKEHIIKEIKEP